jgi:serine/threonine protein kinase
VGTPAYFAPEMVRGLESQLDERTDVFLLGASLAEALSGTVPNPGSTLEDSAAAAARTAVPWVVVVAPGSSRRCPYAGSPPACTRLTGTGMAFRVDDHRQAVPEIRLEAVEG